jgi:hypothetical protein
MKKKKRAKIKQREHEYCRGHEDYNDYSPEKDDNRLSQNLLQQIQDPSKIYPRHPFDPTASNVKVSNGCRPDDHPGSRDLVFDGMRADKTTPVYAMEDGTIIDVRRDSPPCPDPNNCPGFANRVLIQGDDGAYTEYAHISGPIARPPFILFVEYLRRISVGSRVSAGQLLGYVDNSGVTTGPNLHIARFTSGDATTYFERPTCDWSIQGVNE